MSQTRIVFEIARWEFMRWFKVKGQLVTLAVAIVSGLVFAAGEHLSIDIVQVGSSVPGSDVSVDLFVQYS